jgi:hypothetical protein
MWNGGKSHSHQLLKGLLKNVASAAKTRRERPRERNVWGIHEHLEAFRNAVLASAVVFQQTLKRHRQVHPGIYHDGLTGD